MNLFLLFDFAAHALAGVFVLSTHIATVAR